MLRPTSFLCLPDLLVNVATTLMYKYTMSSGKACLFYLWVRRYTQEEVRKGQYLFPNRLYDYELMR